MVPPQTTAVSGFVSQNRLSTQVTGDGGTRLLNRLETAIEQSQAYLLSIQKPEGYWIGELMVDSTLVSDTIAYHHWAGTVDKEWQRKAANHILSMQLPDGGWNIYYGGP